MSLVSLEEAKAPRGRGASSFGSSPLRRHASSVRGLLISRITPPSSKFSTVMMISMAAASAALLLLLLLLLNYREVACVGRQGWAGGSGSRGFRRLCRLLEGKRRSIGSHPSAPSENEPAQRVGVSRGGFGVSRGGGRYCTGTGAIIMEQLMEQRKGVYGKALAVWGSLWTCSIRIKRVRGRSIVLVASGGISLGI